MPTLAELATEFGIDPSVFAAKGDSATKWNGYFSDAENKQRVAEQKMAEAQRSVEFVNGEIAKFGVTETRVAELEASNAAYAAAFEAAKKSGFSVALPDMPKATPKDPVDPLAELRARQDNGFQQLGKAMRVGGKFAETFGKPWTADPVAFVDEALKARMDIEAYAEQKYQFAAETKRKADADLAAKRAEWEAGAVKKYKDDNPTLPGHEQRGMASRYPQVMKPREAADAKAFGNMSAKQRLENSVARGREIARQADTA